MKNFIPLPQLSIVLPSIASATPRKMLRFVRMENEHTHTQYNKLLLLKQITKLVATIQPRSQQFHAPVRQNHQRHIEWINNSFDKMSLYSFIIHSPLYA